MPGLQIMPTVREKILYLTFQCSDDSPCDRYRSISLSEIRWNTAKQKCI